MHTGKVSKRSRQREQLILALRQQPSLAKAAASIGISTVTAWRISKTTEFQEEDRAARRDNDLQLLGRLQHGSSAAGSVLLTGMVEPQASDAAHVRAAVGVLDQTGKAMDWEYRAVRGGQKRGERLSPQLTWEGFCQQYRASKLSASATRRPGRTSKKSRQREQLILALLQQPIREKAAAAIGISAVTAWRISKTTEFQEEYGAACREDFSRTQARLAHGARAAVSVLGRVMVDKNASRVNRARATHCLLDQTRKALKREDLARRAGPQTGCASRLSGRAVTRRAGDLGGIQ